MSPARSRKGRKIDRENVQPVKQIRAESPLANHLQ